MNMNSKAVQINFEAASTCEGLKLPTKEKEKKGVRLS